MRQAGWREMVAEFTPQARSPRLTAVMRILEQKGWARFSLVFLLILVLKWDTLLQPPVWDTAMGLFPPALTLADNGFDLLELLAMPGYGDGGPNVASTSLVTLATAVVLWATGGGARAFLILHLLHFAIAALALLTLFRLARSVFGNAGTALLCVSVLLHPIFSVQVGYLYMEVPLFLFTVLALLAWTEQRFWWAVLWAALAYATKQAGIIVPATLALATLVEQHSPLDKTKRVAQVLAVPVLWTAGVALLRRVAVSRSEDFEFLPSFDAVFGGIEQYLVRFLLNVPDLLVFFVLFLVTAIACLVPIVGALRSKPLDPGTRTQEHQGLLVLGYSGVLIIFFVLLFMVALPVVAGFTVVLPRYYVSILPFLLLWVGYGAKRLFARHLTSPVAVCFVVLSAFFALNSSGALYPLDIDTEGPGNDPPLTERSNAYRRLLALEVEAIRALEMLPLGTAVYYGHYEHYLLQYPELGYASGPLSNRHNFSVESLAELIRGESMPPCIYVLFNYPWLGGEKILGLINFAESTPGYSAEMVREFRDGRYVIILARIRSGDADCPT